MSGIVTVTANATDDTAVRSVQFRVGGTDLGPADTSAPYTATWDTRALPDGPPDLTAVATDTAGLQHDECGDGAGNEPGPVAVLPAQPGATISGTSVTVGYVKAGDWSGGKHLHLRLDGGSTRMDLDADGDRSYTFTGVPAGPHSLEAVVADGSHVELPGTGETLAFSTVAPTPRPPTVASSARRPREPRFRTR